MLEQQVVPFMKSAGRAYIMDATDLEGKRIFPKRQVGHVFGAVSAALLDGMEVSAITAEYLALELPSRKSDGKGKVPPEDKDDLTEERDEADDDAFEEAKDVAAPGAAAKTISPAQVSLARDTLAKLLGLLGGDRQLLDLAKSGIDNRLKPIPPLSAKEVYIAHAVKDFVDGRNGEPLDENAVKAIEEIRAQRRTHYESQVPKNGQLSEERKTVLRESGILEFLEAFDEDKELYKTEKTKWSKKDSEGWQQPSYSYSGIIEQPDADLLRKRGRVIPFYVPTQARETAHDANATNPPADPPEPCRQAAASYDKDNVSRPAYG